MPVKATFISGEGLKGLCNIERGGGDLFIVDNSFLAGLNLLEVAWRLVPETFGSKTSDINATLAN
jgi:hypothetical protein